MDELERELASRGVTRVAGFAQAGADAVVYAVDEDSLALALQTEAAMILAPLGSVADPTHRMKQERDEWGTMHRGTDSRIVAVANPKYAFALAGQWLDSQRKPGVVGGGMVEDGAVVGEGTRVGAGSVVQAGAVVGRDCDIGCNVVMHAGTTIGDRCVIQSGVVLGGMGFGYVRGPDGRHLRFPQIGTLWIGDDVEIGANTTIDRGALGETRIGRGTKIDNLCHIAHNCIVGEDVLMAAQVGMAGSCVIEDGAMLGGQVGLGERVTIGKGTVLGGQGGVLPGKRIDGEGVVYWGTPAQPVREYLRDLAKLRKRQ